MSAPAEPIEEIAPAAAAEPVEKIEPAAAAEPAAPAAAGATDEGSGELARFAVAGAIVSLSSIAATIVRTKVVAIFLGPVGVGAVAEVTQLVTLATVVAMVAGGPSLTTWIAVAQRDGDRDRVQRGISASIGLALALAGLGGLVAIAAARHVLPNRDWGFPMEISVACSAGGVLFTTMTGIVTTTLTTLKDVGATTRHAIIVLILTTPLSIGLTIGLGLRGQFLSLVAGSALAFCVSTMVMRRSPAARSLRLWPAWSTEYATRAFLVGATLVVTQFSRQWVYAAVRKTLQTTGGVELGEVWNGNYSAALSIVGVYFDLALSALFTYFAPRFAAAPTAEALATEVDGATDFSLRVASPVVFAAITFREPIIHALYSRRFDLAISLLGIMFCGDILRAVCYAHSAPLLYKGKLRAFLVTEGFFVLAGAASAVAGIKLYGPIGVGYAYVLVHVPYLFLVRGALRSACGAKTRTRNVALTLLATAGAVAFSLVAERVPQIRWGAMPVTVIWMWKTGALAPILNRLRPLVTRGR